MDPLNCLPAPLAAGAVLAGGASRRMGQDKAALLLDGEPLLARVVRRLRAVTPEVLVVGPTERRSLVPTDVPVVPDDRPGLGPLGAIATALRASAASAVVVVACDMPFVRPELVRYLLDLAEAGDAAVVVPRSPRGTEPLHAVYRRECLPVADALLEAGDLAVAALYARVRTRLVAPAEWAPYDPLGLSVFNANSPAEWERAQALVADGGR
jgi:molybdopterin-guanine dinucleotide biosynthesis protein A